MSFFKKKDEEAKEKDKSFSKKAIDASKVLVGAIAVKAADEISKIVVDYPKKPKDVSRREFTKTKPTRTFTKAARTVKFWENNPEYIPHPEDRKPKKGFFDPDYMYQKPVQRYSVVPGLDGLVSFSILLAPFAILLGLINQIFKDNFFVDILLWFSLFIYILFIALPGAYLGLDAIRDGTKALLVNSGATIKFGLKGIYYFFKIFFQGIYELFVLFFTTFFENILDYWVFITGYVISFILLFLTADFVIQGEIVPLTLFLLVIIPALLPASVLHRYWMLFRFNRRTR